MYLSHQFQFGEALPSPITKQPSLCGLCRLDLWHPHCFTSYSLTHLFHSLVTAITRPEKHDRQMMSRNNKISPTQDYEQVRAVADEPTPVQHAFLRTLYSHLFLSTTAFSLATVALCRSDARSVLAHQPLLLVPFALVWLAALTGWARTRARIRSDNRSRAISDVSGALNIVAHAAEAVTCGGLFALGFEAVNSHVLANLPSAIDVYPIVGSPCLLDRFSMPVGEY